MSYKALTVLALPVMEDREVHPGVVVPVPTGESARFEAGDEISDSDLEEHGQSKEQIKALVDEGILSKDMDADLHPDHQPHDPLRGPDNGQ